MHGLVGDRFLKHFFGGLSRRRRINPADEAGPGPENKGNKANQSDRQPRENVQGKEEAETSEKTNEITEPLDRKDDLDRSSGATQLPDELEQRK